MDNVIRSIQVVVTVLRSPPPPHVTLTVGLCTRISQTEALGIVGVQDGGRDGFVQPTLVYRGWLFHRALYRRQKILVVRTNSVHEPGKMQMPTFHVRLVSFYTNLWQQRNLECRRERIPSVVAAAN